METQLVVAAYIIYKGKVLLIHHNKLNLWLPVGGHIEKNETPDEAVLREAKEEVGLDIEILSDDPIAFSGNMKKQLAVPFHVNVHSVGDHDHCCLFYLCRAKSDKISISARELKDFHWFSKQELFQDYVPDDVRNIALRALQLCENYCTK